MTDRLVIELDGDSALIAQLDVAIAGLARPSELMQNIAAIEVRNVNLRFSSKRDPNGQPWPQISELTPMIYASVHKTAKVGADGETIIPPMPGSLLQRTNLMMQSLSPNSGDTWAEWGFGRPYAIYHETGTERNDKPYMPRRGLLTGDPERGTLGAEDAQDLQDEINDFMAGLLGT